MEFHKGLGKILQIFISQWAYFGGTSGRMIREINSQTALRTRKRAYSKDFWISCSYIRYFSQSSQKLKNLKVQSQFLRPTFN